MTIYNNRLLKPKNYTNSYKKNIITTYNLLRSKIKMRKN